MPQLTRYWNNSTVELLLFVDEGVRGDDLLLELAARLAELTARIEMEKRYGYTA